MRRYARRNRDSYPAGLSLVLDAGSTFVRQNSPLIWPLAHEISHYPMAIHAKDKRKYMTRTYKAVQVTKPGKLEVVERAMIEPGFGQVRVRVEACGVCHSDALTVEGGFPGLTYPRVPGHEAIGRIDAIGSGVQGWKEGQRVGVGYMGGHCGYCANCRRGDFVNCQNQPISGTS